MHEIHFRFVMATAFGCLFIVFAYYDTSECLHVCVLHAYACGVANYRSVKALIEIPLQCKHPQGVGFHKHDITDA